jgi:hypothetical protein
MDSTFTSNRVAAAHDQNGILSATGGAISGADMHVRVQGCAFKGTPLPQSDVCCLCLLLIGPRCKHVLLYMHAGNTVTGRGSAAGGAVHVDGAGLMASSATFVRNMVNCTHTTSNSPCWARGGAIHLVRLA